MKPAAFEYVRAASVAEAASPLADGAPDARLLAGGRSLGPLLTGWTHAEIEDSKLEDPARGLLRHVARGIAYRAVRNRGTLGGSPGAPAGDVGFL